MDGFRDPPLRLVPDVVAKVAIDARLAQLVAIHARDHGNVSFLRDGVAFTDRPVANRAGHAGVEVCLVVEEDEVGKFINANP